MVEEDLQGEVSLMNGNQRRASGCYEDRDVEESRIVKHRLGLETLLIQMEGVIGYGNTIY